MRPAIRPAAPESASADLDLGSVMRSCAFVLIMMLSWLSVTPFQNMADPDLLSAQEVGDVANQLAYLGAGALVTAVLVAIGPRVLLPLARPLYGLVLAWLIVSVATSTHPDISARRLVFALLVMYLAAAILVLPRDIAHFAGLLAGVVLGVLALCWIGVALYPERAIHQAFDLIEARLAGDWRGVFPHKNIAGAMMVIFICIGLFVAQVRNRALGWLTVAGAFAFLLCCDAKTDTLLLPVVLTMSWACTRLRSRAALAGTTLTILVILNVITVGTVLSPAIAAFTRLLPDPTFTGRTEIWSFAVDHIPQRWATGYGFMAFWRTEAVEFGATLSDAQTAAHAHNGFLDLILTIGAPGLALAVIAFVIAPVGDFAARSRDPHSEALALLFLRIWLCGAYTSSFESVLLDRGNPIWFTMLIAIFGLRFLAVRSVARTASFGVVAGARPYVAA